MLLPKARVDLGVMVMKEYSAFSKAAFSKAGVSPSDCFVSKSKTFHESVLPLCRDAVGVFCSPSRLGQNALESHWMPNSFGLVPHVGKKLSKLQNEGRRIARFL